MHGLLRTCFVMVTTLQLDIVHRLCAQANVLEEEEELADLVGLKACMSRRFI